ncbi:MAG: tRNA uridine-5-carboxymethylaminomethyl(34) synthesis GTPase MnmE [Rhodobiaceae bacterium]|nr:tRNA uridine-5-carboxymethylaminomethyl(34) synthesis GTPase MnmE [Rhodobiaceae bacterium]MCC0049287.1 tRNA uridine-5-carboxymethylaminomethyl(34) synthesis GTPase MnmE [Rhodobiaceae bacterium]
MKHGGDTIFALSSGHGRSGVAVIRLSGPQVRFALETMCGAVPAPRKAYLRAVMSSGGELIDRGLVLFFEAPASFTGEDLAELQVHGGRAVVDAVLGSLGTLDGLRPAEPGEFARRAFENGKLDLSAVEGLADLIDSETEGQRRAALAQAEGGLAEIYNALRKQALELRALAEASVDFVDEGDVPDSMVDRIADGCEGLLAALKKLSDGFQRGRRIRDGLVIAVIGKPNAGKSSLVNWLANRDIAIVSDEPGTTRDLIEARLDIAGVPVSVFDTAGLRDNAGSVEAEGIRRARSLVERADLVIELIDSDSVQIQSSELNLDKSGDKSSVTHWHVLSRADLNGHGNVRLPAISTVTGDGLNDLLERIGTFVKERAAVGGEAIMTHERHKIAVDEAMTAVVRCRGHLGGDFFELAAEELRLAGDALGRITGAIHTEDILGEIFSAFCIGK